MKIFFLFKLRTWEMKEREKKFHWKITDLVHDLIWEIFIPEYMQEFIQQGEKGASAVG